MIALVGCLDRPPVFHAPVWSTDGRKVFYAVVRTDGHTAVRRVDVESGASDEFTGVRFEAPVAALAVAPSGREVALALLRRRRLELHLVSATGTSRVVWSTPCGPGSCEIAWLPDGLALVAAVEQSGSAVLWHVPLSGKDCRKLFDGTGGVRAPAVAAGAGSVAFLARLHADAPWSLYVATPTKGSRRVASALCRQVAPGYGPRWSPDGGELAYVAERHLAPGYAEVRAVRFATGEHRLIARSLTGACLAPAWSPNGAVIACVRLAFRARNGSDWHGRPADIVLCPASGGMAQPVVSDAMLNAMPAWSPDGRTLAFNTAAGPEAQPHVVRLLDVRTGAIRPLHPSPFRRFLAACAQAVRGSRRVLREAEALAEDVAAVEDRRYAHARLADLMGKLGQWASAATHAARTTEGPSPSPETLRLLVTALLRTGQPEPAAAAAERLAVLTGLARDAERRDAIQRAVATVRRLRASADLADTPSSLLPLARAYVLDLDDATQGLPLCLRLLRRFPGTPEAAHAAPLLFLCHRSLGALSVAYDDLERAAARLGDDAITPAQALTLAAGAAAAGRDATALAWLDRAGDGPDDHAWRETLSAACLQVARQFRAVGALDAALEALERGAALGPSEASARNSLEAADLLAGMGRHKDVPDLLLGAFIDEADIETLRRASRLMTSGRLSRRERASYDAARVGELVRFGFHDAAASLGEQLLTDPRAEGPYRRRVKAHLADAYDGLVAYHLAREDLPAARSTVDRWLRVAEPEYDLGQALERLAACQTLAGQGQEAIATLTRIVAECPGSSQAAAARRHLLEQRLP